MKYFISLFFIVIVTGVVQWATAEGRVNPFSFRKSYTLNYSEGLKGSGKNKIEILKDQPTVRFKKWNGEVDMGVTYEKVKAKAEKSFLSDKVEWKDGNEEVHAYPIKSRADIEGDAFEIEVILNQKSDTNKFDFHIDNYENLNFYYQPPLNEEYPERGCSETECISGGRRTYRPENVVGSYAIYHKAKKDYVIGDTNYGNGKAFHVYRPKAFDSAGREKWAKLEYKDGVLTVVVPQEFLDNATYPVIVDPTFGYTSLGATYDCDSTGNTYYYQLGDLSPSGSNTATNHNIGQTSNCGDSRTNKMALYSESGGNPASKLVEDGSTTASSGNVFATGPTISYSLTASTQYWIGSTGSVGSQSAMWDTGGSKSIKWQSGSALPTSPVIDLTICSSCTPSAYVTYTANSIGPHVNVRGGGGGAVNPPVKIRGGPSSGSTDSFTGTTLYVNTGSTTGGDCTTNDISGPNRACPKLLDAVNLLPSTLSTPYRIYATGSAADTSAINQTPWDQTTSATNYIWIIGEQSPNHFSSTPTGYYDTSKYRLEVSNSNALYNNLPGHLRIEGLQIKITRTSGDGYIGIKCSNSNQNYADVDCRISNNIVIFTGTKGNTIGIENRPAGQTGASAKVWNNLVYDFGQCYTSDLQDAEYYNNTAAGCTYGFVQSDTPTYKVVNNLVTGATIGFVGSFASGSNYNAEDDGNGAPGAQSRSGVSFSFVNAGGKDFHLQSSDTGAKDYGTPNPASELFSDDIDGQTRSGSWDIGADEQGASLESGGASGGSVKFR